MTFSQRLSRFTKRWTRLFGFWLLISVAPFFALLINENPEHLRHISVRVAVQSFVLISLGAWWTPQEVVRFLRRLHVPQEILDLLNSILHFGYLLAQETDRKVQALKLRFVGNSILQQPALVGNILASSAELTFDRLVRVEEAKAVRMVAHEPHGSNQVQSDGPALEIKNLNFQASDGTPILKDFSLTVRRGEWVAITGPSGCGKTTLLRIISGLIAPQSGEVLRLGKNISSLKQKNRLSCQVQMLFQDPWDQILGVTPFEDLTYNLITQKVPAAEMEPKILAVAEQVGLSHRLHKSVAQLSFGERKRVCVAQLLLSHSEIILCDEPTSGLDPKNVQALIELLENKFHNKTVLWVTHDLHQLPSRLDRRVEMQTLI